MPLFRRAPAGSNTQVQFNDGGVFGGDTAFIWDKTNNRLGINKATAAEALHVVGNFQVDDAETATKGYRFRTSGSDLDLDASGATLLISVYSDAGFAGTQRSYMRFGASGNFVTVAHGWEWKEGGNVFGTTRHSINGDGGVVFNASFADADLTAYTDTGYASFFSDASNDAAHVMNNTAGKISFFGATATTRPTGVAVTAAGIHAALVTLGLITA